MDVMTVAMRILHKNIMMTELLLNLEGFQMHWTD